tara:strand:- start:70 stop:645 length:576 start_codon:yes stop_codon:yes gene_type:complete
VARSVPEGIRGLRLSERVSVLKGIRMLDRLRDRPWRSREVVWRPILHFKHILLIGGFGPSVPRNIEAWRDLESTLLGFFVCQRALGGDLERDTLPSRSRLGHVQWHLFVAANFLKICAVVLVKLAVFSVGVVFIVGVVVVVLPPLFGIIPSEGLPYLCVVASVRVCASWAAATREPHVFMRHREGRGRCPP